MMYLTNHKNSNTKCDDSTATGGVWYHLMNVSKTILNEPGSDEASRLERAPRSLSSASNLSKNNVL